MLYNYGNMYFDKEDFESKYCKKVREDDPIYIRFLERIDDEKNIDEMVFLNDNYFIPPSDYFTRKNKDVVTSDVANDRNKKQYIGAYFGYLFKFILADKFNIKYKAMQKKYPFEERYVLSSASYYMKEK
jgi:hypothetical protein